MPVRRPYAYGAVLSFLGPRATPGVEQVEGDAYRRTFSIGADEGWLEVRPCRDGLEVAVCGGSPKCLLELRRRVARLFDTDADWRSIAEHLRTARFPPLTRSLEALPGLRVPGAFEPFESLVRIVLGQQVSVGAATTLAGRLAQAFGAEISAGNLTRMFPSPNELAEAPLERIGLPRARAESLRRISRAVAEGILALDRARPEQMLAFDGIGPWTAEAFSMRVLGDPDAFPSGDRALHRAAKVGSATELRQLAERWRPYRAYAAMHLWLLPEETDERRAVAV